MSVIKLEKSGPIATLTLTRPDMMNALGQEGDGPAVAAACAMAEDSARRLAPAATSTWWSSRSTISKCR